jgi:hypothetical protein
MIRSHETPAAPFARPFCIAPAAAGELTGTSASVGENRQKPQRGRRSANKSAKIRLDFIVAMYEYCS